MISYFAHFDGYSTPDCAVLCLDKLCVTFILFMIAK